MRLGCRRASRRAARPGSPGGANICTVLSSCGRDKPEVGAPGTRLEAKPSGCSGGRRLGVPHRSNHVAAEAQRGLHGVRAVQLSPRIGVEAETAYRRRPRNGAGGGAGERSRASRSPCEQELPATPTLSFTPEAVVLYRSWLTPEGAVYEALASSELAATGC